MKNATTVTVKGSVNNSVNSDPIKRFAELFMLHFSAYSQPIPKDVHKIVAAASASIGGDTRAHIIAWAATGAASKLAGNGKTFFKVTDASLSPLGMECKAAYCRGSAAVTDYLSGKQQGRTAK